MNKITCPKLGYRISSETSNGFKNVSFQIFKRGEFNSTSMDELLIIRFQSDATNKGWYGMRTTIEARGNGVDHVTDALKLLKKIIPNNMFEESPEKLIEKFLELKIERVAYDSRLSQYVTEKTLPDATLTRWMDGYKYYNNDYGCSIAVLAENEDDARNKIMKEFACNVSQGHSTATFEKWIAANKPVEQNAGCYANSAQFPSMDFLMKPLA